MPTAIFKDDVRKLLEDGAQLVEVLPRVEYEDEHLASAINIPLKELNRETRFTRRLPPVALRSTSSHFRPSNSPGRIPVCTASSQYIEGLEGSPSATFSKRHARTGW
jgi:hypothetical protein